MLHGLLSGSPLGNLLLQVDNSHVVRNKNVGRSYYAYQAAQGGCPKPAIAAFAWIGFLLRLNDPCRVVNILELIHLDF